VFEDLF